MDVGEEAGEGGPEPEWNAIEASEDPVALHGLLLLRTRSSLYIRFVCTVLERILDASRFDILFNPWLTIDIQTIR